jgi:hypothetical protein
VAGCCECGDEISGSCTIGLVSYDYHIHTEFCIPGSSVSLVTGIKSGFIYDSCHILVSHSAKVKYCNKGDYLLKIYYCTKFHDLTFSVILLQHQKF